MDRPRTLIISNAWHDQMCTRFAAPKHGDRKSHCTGCHRPSPDKFELYLKRHLMAVLMAEQVLCAVASGLSAAHGATDLVLFGPPGWRDEFAIVMKRLTTPPTRAAKSFSDHGRISLFNAIPAFPAGAPEHTCQKSCVRLFSLCFSVLCAVYPQRVASDADELLGNRPSGPAGVSRAKRPQVARASRQGQVPPCEARHEEGRSSSRELKLEGELVACAAATGG